MAALLAIASVGAHAADIKDYRPVFQECRQGDGPTRLTIRRMTVDGTATMLTVDPITLATHLERAQDWSCADTDDAHQTGTRYIRAVRASCAASSPLIVNGGLVHGVTAAGSFVTGDLCPSHRPLDRVFLENLEKIGSTEPVALSISGTWLTHHAADFAWLRAQEHADLLKITWVDHSYDHPFVPGRPLADNFLLMPGVDIQKEILDTERLLIAGGETPSVFFRFPGLVSNPALMQAMQADHLIVLGADAWLAKTGQAKPGGIILVHMNGNEPAGLKIFSDLLAAGKLPQPFRPVEEVP
jgi:hypothetical protein